MAEGKPAPVLKLPAQKSRLKKEENRSLDVSRDSSRPSDSSSSCSRGDNGLSEQTRHSGWRSVKVVPEPVKVGIVDASWLLLPEFAKSRCTWITPYSGECLLFSLSLFFFLKIFLFTISFCSNWSFVTREYGLYF